MKGPVGIIDIGPPLQNQWMRLILINAIAAKSLNEMAVLVGEFWRTGLSVYFMVMRSGLKFVTTCCLLLVF